MPGAPGRSGGSNKKTREAHILTGTFRANRHGHGGEDSANPGWPPLPAHLGAVGRREWSRLAQLLADEHRLTVSDGPLLEVAAGACELAHSISRRRRRRGIADVEWLRLQRAERIQLAAYARALGDLCLTSLTRTRAPKAAKQPTANHEEQLRQRRRFFGA